MDPTVTNGPYRHASEDCKIGHFSTSDGEEDDTHLGHDVLLQVDVIGEGHPARVDPEDPAGFVRICSNISSDFRSEYQTFSWSSRQAEGTRSYGRS